MTVVDLVDLVDLFHPLRAYARARAREELHRIHPTISTISTKIEVLR